MLLKIKLDPSISSIDIYTTARVMLDKFYEENPEVDYLDFYNIEEQIKTSYINSMFDNLVNLLDSLDFKISNDDLLVIVNVIYRLKGLRESLEYLFIDVLKSDFDLEYNYIDFNITANINNLSIANLTKFNIYMRNIINELLYTRNTGNGSGSGSGSGGSGINLQNLVLNINIIKRLSYGSSQTYFNDFRIIKGED